MLGIGRWTVLRYPLRIEISPSQHLLISASTIVDGAGVIASPGELLLGPRISGGRMILAVGNPSAVRAAAAKLASTPVILDRSSSVLVPGFVNAHTHLDLSLIGPVASNPDDGFMGFINLVRSTRPTDTDDIAQAVEAGIRLSIAGGVVAVGDIAGAAGGVPQSEPFKVLSRSGLSGVSFIEFFAIGRGESSGLSRLDACLSSLATHPVSDVRIGISPHATNTVSLSAYRHAIHLSARGGLPVMTHAAETLEERAFIALAQGPQRELLERLGLWDDQLLTDIGRGNSPIAHLAPLLADARMILVHINDSSPADIAILASTKSPVVYCPRASAYFNAPEHLGPHQYSAMLKAGIRVALGTDSIINLGRSDRITPFDDAASLVSRDGLDPTLALAMITTQGAAVLGLDPAGFKFAQGAVMRGCNAISPQRPTDWASIFRSNSAIELIQ